MQIHGRAKLGPAGRVALTQAVMDGMTSRQARWALRYLVGHGSSLVEAAVACQPR